MQEIKEDAGVIIDAPAPLYKLSVSKLKTFESCKAKFHFSYIEHLPKKDWDFLTFGKFAHEILEKFHQSIINGDERPDHLIISEAYKSSFINYKEKLTKDQVDLVKIMVQQYLVKRSVEKRENRAPKVTDVEKKFSITVNDTFIINGFIDRVQIDHDGVLCVSDYKTSKEKKYLEKDFFQLLTYCYVMLKEMPELKKIRVSYIMLRHNFDEIVKEFDASTIMKVENKFAERYHEIQEERLFRPKTSPLCGYCDYIDSCADGRDFLQSIGKGKISFGKER